MKKNSSLRKEDFCLLLEEEKMNLVSIIYLMLKNMKIKWLLYIKTAKRMYESLWKRNN